MAEPTRERPTQAQRRDGTRQRLLDSATELFSQSGYHGTQVMDIVSKAHVSAGTFYRYFEDKQAIFFAIAQKLADHELQEAKKTHVLFSTAADFASTVTSMVQYYEAHFERVLAQAALYRCLLHSGVVDPARDHLWKMNERSTAALADHLRNAGITDTRDHESLARMILGIGAELRFSMIHSGQPTAARAARLATRCVIGALAAFTTQLPSHLKPSEQVWAATLQRLTLVE